MIVNYLLLIICGIASVVGIISWKRGSLYSSPMFTIAAVIVFILALIATLLGIPFNELQHMIDGGQKINRINI